MRSNTIPLTAGVLPGFMNSYGSWTVLNALNQATDLDAHQNQWMHINGASAISSTAGSMLSMPRTKLRKS